MGACIIPKIPTAAKPYVKVLEADPSGGGGIVKFDAPELSIRDLDMLTDVLRAIDEMAGMTRGTCDADMDKASKMLTRLVAHFPRTDGEYVANCIFVESWLQDPAAKKINAFRQLLLDHGAKSENLPEPLPTLPPGVTAR